MKRVISSFILFLCLNHAFAQSTSTTVKFNKLSTPALMLLLPYNEEIAQGAIIQKLKEIGYTPETSGALLWKKNTVDGYYQFKNVVLHDMQGKVVDLYFKVDQKSRKEKNQSYIYMLIGTRENIFASSESEPAAFSAGNKFLDSFIEYSASYKMDVDIQDQEEIVQAAEKKYNKLKDEQRDLEDRIKTNRIQQENQSKLMEAERKRLEELKAKKQNKI